MVSQIVLIIHINRILGGIKIRKRFLLKISAVVTAFLLILAIFLIVNSFLGSSVSANIAKSKAQSYIKDKYSRLSLEIKDVTYNLKDGSYLIFVSSSTSIDTHFFLRHREGEDI